MLNFRYNREKDELGMKEALFEKIKYLLAYKLKTEDLRYQRLLEQLFFEFIENADKLYNNGNI